MNAWHPAPSSTTLVKDGVLAGSGRRREKGKEQEEAHTVVKYLLTRVLRMGAFSSSTIISLPARHSYPSFPLAIYNCGQKNKYDEGEREGEGDIPRWQR